MYYMVHNKESRLLGKTRGFQLFITWLYHLINLRDTIRLRLFISILAYYVPFFYRLRSICRCAGPDLSPTLSSCQRCTYIQTAGSQSLLLVGKCTCVLLLVGRHPPRLHLVHDVLVHGSPRLQLLVGFLALKYYLAVRSNSKIIVYAVESRVLGCHWAVCLVWKHSIPIATARSSHVDEQALLIAPLRRHSFVSWCRQRLYLLVRLRVLDHQESQVIPS
ncbi:hypothetical protein GGR57DRAFT_450376 [Xylariaceae sp. FL1272]|nr:hypothetical protein GGR57DRAFT_450376 [Xylariaceae sp. FL1272]